MSKPKKLIDEFFNRAERIVNDFFGLVGTSGSGRTVFDKLDGKNDLWRVEVKATHKPSKSINLKDFQEWKLKAARDRKQMFAVIMFTDDTDALSIENSVTVVDTRLFKDMWEMMNEPN